MCPYVGLLIGNSAIYVDCDIICKINCTKSVNSLIFVFDGHVGQFSLFGEADDVVIAVLRVTK